MADSVITPTVNSHAAVGKWDMIMGTLAVAAGDYPAGGLTIDLSSCTEIKSNSIPFIFFLVGVAGYIYSYVKGATKDAGLLKILQSPAGGGALEEPTSTTPSGVVMDTISFIALFPLLK